MTPGPDAPAVFTAGPGAPGHGRCVAARDGRSAAWMAAGWASVAGEAGTVVATGDWDHDEAVRAAAGCRAPVHCFGPGGVAAAYAAATAGPAGAGGPPSDGAAGESRGSRTLHVERLIAEMLAALPPQPIVCVDEPALASLVRAGAAGRGDVLVVERAAGPARGATLAVATGAKVAARTRTVAALVPAAEFAPGDLETAGRHGLAVAAIVVSEPGGPPYETVAAVAGGHGEPVADAMRLPLHLRNAFAASIPTVINARVAASRL